MEYHRNKPSHSRGQLIFGKDAKATQLRGERIISSTDDGDDYRATCKKTKKQKMNLVTYLTPYTKINIKWAKDLNITTKALNLLQEKRHKSL